VRKYQRHGGNQAWDERISGRIMAGGARNQKISRGRYRRLMAWVGAAARLIMARAPAGAPRNKRAASRWRRWFIASAQRGSEIRHRNGGGKA